MPDVHKRDPFLQMDTVYQKKRECATLFPLDFDFDPASGYSSRPNVIKLNVKMRRKQVEKIKHNEIWVD